jgi:hypothetical protein
MPPMPIGNLNIPRPRTSPTRPHPRSSRIAHLPPLPPLPPGPGKITAPARPCGRIFKEAFSGKEPIDVWIGGERWGRCRVSQFVPAARAYRRLFPREAFAALEGILEGIAHRAIPKPKPDNASVDASNPVDEEDAPIENDASRTWPLVIPLYIEWAGIDWDRPFPLEYLRVGSSEKAPEVLAELKRRKSGAP